MVIGGADLMCLSRMTTLATIAAAASFGSSSLLKNTLRPDFDSRTDSFRIHEFCAGIGLF
jgi:hypothetical protein